MPEPRSTLANNRGETLDCPRDQRLVLPGNRLLKDHGCRHDGPLVRRQEFRECLQRHGVSGPGEIGSSHLHGGRCVFRAAGSVPESPLDQVQPFLDPALPAKQLGLDCDDLRGRTGDLQCTFHQRLLEAEPPSGAGIREAKEGGRAHTLSRPELVDKIDRLRISAGGRVCLHEQDGESRVLA